MGEDEGLDQLLGDSRRGSWSDSHGAVTAPAKYSPCTEARDYCAAAEGEEPPEFPEGSCVRKKKLAVGNEGGFFFPWNTADF